jgi:outer membrane immunogenic protein
LSAVFIAGGTALGGNALQAADLGPGLKDSYEGPALLWQGFYVGLNGGGILDGEARYDFVPGLAVAHDTNSVDLSGLTVGAHGGYNAQFGRFVLGAEVDFNFAKTDDPTSCIFFGGRCESSINELYSARLRLGVTLRDNILLYGTGGLALANVEHTVDFGGQPFEDKSTVDGIVYGGGLEFMHHSGVTFGVEVLHYDFEKETFNLIDHFGNTIPTDIDMDSTVVRARVGLQFN